MSRTCTSFDIMEHMDKIDFKKTMPSYQAKHNVWSVADVPAIQYLMVDGQGDPNTAKAYQNAIEALYPVAYKLKFASKSKAGQDYTVMPLEGLWWSADMAAFTTARDKSKWSWTMMIMQPDWITQTMFEEAVAKVKLKTMPASLGLVRLKTLHEGHCVQTLHIGSYDDEADVLAAMHYDFLPANKLRPTMKHHEVYLSDARKVGPDKLRTILRQPVENL